MQCRFVMNLPNCADAIAEYYHRREAMAAAEAANVPLLAAPTNWSALICIRDCRDRFSSRQRAAGRTLETTYDAIVGRRVSGLDLGISELTNLMGPLEARRAAFHRWRRENRQERSGLAVLRQPRAATRATRSNDLQNLL